MMKKEQQDKEYYKFRNYFAWSGFLIFLVVGLSCYSIIKDFGVLSLSKGMLCLYTIMLVTFISGFFGNIRARLFWLSSLSIIFYFNFFIILLLTSTSEYVSKYLSGVSKFFLHPLLVILTVIAFILALKSLEVKTIVSKFTVKTPLKGIIFTKKTPIKGIIFVNSYYTLFLSFLLYNNLKHLNFKNIDTFEILHTISIFVVIVLFLAASYSLFKQRTFGYIATPILMTFFIYHWFIAFSLYDEVFFVSITDPLVYLLVLFIFFRYLAMVPPGRNDIDEKKYFINQLAGLGNYLEKLFKVDNDVDKSGD